MEQFVEKRIRELREYLRREKHHDHRDLQYEIEGRSTQFYDWCEKKADELRSFDIDGMDIFHGILDKVQLLYGMSYTGHNRNRENLLAEYLDIWGTGFIEPNCKYDSDQFLEIQQLVTITMAKKAKEAPKDTDETALLSGIIRPVVTQEKMNHIVNNMSGMTKDITKYVDYYRTAAWNWRVDSSILAQYIFEKAAEFTYKVMKGEDMSEWCYDIRDAFYYFEVDIPEPFQNIMDSAVPKLRDVIWNIEDLIERKDYNTCPLEIWFRPILFNAALFGVQFTLMEEF